MNELFSLRSLYLLLLIVGAISFFMHVYAQSRFKYLLRTRYPDKWNIIAHPEHGRSGYLYTWARLQQILRSNVPELFDDEQLHYWHRVWRFAPWLAWPCLMGALIIQGSGALR